jgi:hypothetical protein
MNEIEDKVTFGGHSSLSCIDVTSDLLLELSLDSEFDKRRRKDSTDSSLVE